MIKWEYKNKPIVVLSLLGIIVLYCVVRIVMDIVFSHTISIGDIFIILTFFATLAIIYRTYWPAKKQQLSKVRVKKSPPIDLVFLIISLAVLFMAVGLWVVVVLRGIGIPSVFFALIFLAVSAIAFGYTKFKVKEIGRAEQQSEKTKQTKKSSKA